MTEIRTREVPALDVVTETRTVGQADLQAWLPDAMARTAAAAGPRAIRAASQSWLEHPTDDQVFVVIYEGNPNEAPTEVEVCAPVTGGGDRTDPAHREAYARVTKGTVLSGGLGAVYEAVEKWVAAEGLRVAAAPREVYWTDFMSAGEDDEVFDVAFPIA
jgi:hypothetical protein